jgi:hypothetical protein
MESEKSKFENKLHERRIDQLTPGYEERQDPSIKETKRRLLEVQAEQAEQEFLIKVDKTLKRCIEVLYDKFVKEDDKRI